MSKDGLLDSYNQAVHDYNNRVCRFADKLLINRTVAKDITQETYMRLWENKEKIDFNKVKSWLFTTAYRLCMDYMKKNYKQREDVLFHEEPSYNLETPDLKEIINKALVLLSETQRTILLLKDYEGYSYGEIGEMIGLSESQVKVYLFRGRSKIKAHIKDLKLVL